MRAESEDPWQALGLQVGLSMAEIESIEKRLVQDRYGLVEREYAKVVDQFRIPPKSPTYFWEGRLVDDIRGIEFFSSLSFSSADQSCTSEQ